MAVQCSRLCEALLAARDFLPTWDKQIELVCQQVNQIVDKITALHPEWVAQVLETRMT